MINLAVNTVETMVPMQESLTSSSVAAIGELQYLVERFAAAENKRNILNELKPAYLRLISAVDAEHEHVAMIVDQKMTALQSLLSKRLIEIRRAERTVEKIVEAIELEGSLELNFGFVCKRYVDAATGLDERYSLERQLGEFSQLIAALKENREAVLAAEPVLNQIDDLEQSLNHCAAHRVKVRYAWADALAACGAASRSQNVILEAMSIQMGLPVEELKRSRKRRNEREREHNRKAVPMLGRIAV